MSQTEGTCPVCKKAFAPGDDVVTCPECGAPYHRTCYEQEGQCVYAAQHGGGFEYKSPQTEAKAGPQKQNVSGGPKNSGGVLCRVCSTVNDAQNIFCSNCGSPLRAPAGYGAETPPAQGYGLGGTQQNHGYGRGTAAHTVQGSDLDGIPVHDWATFIGPNAQTYLHRMAVMRMQNRKFSFMFTAFLISPFYFVYRKLWGWAGLAFAMELLAGGLAYVYYGALGGFSLLPFLSMQTLETVNSVSTIVFWAVHMLLGFMALPMYKNHAKKKILALRETTGGGENYQAQLAKKGGVSAVAVVVMVVAFFAFFNGMLQLGGDAFLQAILDGIAMANGL